jgi:hypothetical protein
MRIYHMLVTFDVEFHVRCSVFSVRCSAFGVYRRTLIIERNTFFG